MRRNESHDDLYINAYNALAMYGIVDAGVPKSLGGLTKLRFFYLRKFVLGGKSISLYDFENQVIRPLGEERNVKAEPAKREAWLSAIFDFYPEDFLKHAPSLTEYLNRYRSEPIPSDFKVRFFDYDWTVNAPGRAGAS